jgi:hypothetical protein
MTPSQGPLYRCLNLVQPNRILDLLQPLVLLLARLYQRIVANFLFGDCGLQNDNLIRQLSLPDRRFRTLILACFRHISALSYIPSSTSKPDTQEYSSNTFHKQR